MDINPNNFFTIRCPRCHNKRGEARPGSRGRYVCRQNRISFCATVEADGSVTIEKESVKPYPNGRKFVPVPPSHLIG